jgi:uncharacterized protein (DUF305 family)
MQRFSIFSRTAIIAVLVCFTTFACKNKTAEPAKEQELSEEDKAYIQQALNYHQMAMKVEDTVHETLDNLTGMELISDVSKKQIKAINQRFLTWEIRLVKVEGGVRGLELDYDKKHPEMITRKMLPKDQALYQRTLLDTINAINISLLEFEIK